MSTLALATVLMAAAVIAVPISKRLGLGSVLGYLAAGIILGPAGLDVAGDVDSILHFAELGVVLLLFVIGLELQPSRLWTMRRPVFGLGGVQVMLTAAVLGPAAWLAGLSPATAVIVGLSLALSSTAFALQVMAERGELTTKYGRGAFSILLFQDLAVIPILALIPLLAVREGAAMGASEVLLATGRVVVAIGVVAVGRYVLRHVLRLVAATQIREVFTAMALLIVVGTALLMEAVGLSMALGAFLAGVLLADSEYRHALEADIEPFKGLLLGLFFIAVGMSVDLGLLVAQPLTIAGIAAGLMAIKAAILYGLGRAYYRNADPARRLALALSQGGEFAFVIFGFATGIGALERGVADILILAVTASMMATPLLLTIQDAVLKRVRAAPAVEDFEMPEPEENRVIIAGFGRFGQIVGRLLRARKIGFTALESSAAQVDFVRRYGNKVYYGDPSRLDLLRAAKAESAEIFVVAVDDVEASVRTVETVREYFPHLKIYARARNRPHAYRLMELGVDVIQRETFLSSLDVGRQVLEGLGFSPSEAARTTEMFREHDVRRLEAHFGEHRDEEKMMRLAGEWARELEELFEEDVAEEAAE